MHEGSYSSVPKDARNGDIRPALTPASIAAAAAPNISIDWPERSATSTSAAKSTSPPRRIWPATGSAIASARTTPKAPTPPDLS